ncbi:MAG: threonine synthase [Flammeovirgaceae bacterium]|jgi:threonine synthase|nr:threonine synthase [Flammeovirgaceae bacterium]|tara:strand:+ start:4473 stop:5756 length:1284 start_codon:yes stop_codon:yes gene_type:complete
MQFYSTNNPSYKVNFEQAVFKSLPPDNGLFYPQILPRLDPDWIKNLNHLSKTEIGLMIASKFIGDEIPMPRLAQIVSETIDFDIPLVKITDHISSLELYHGPTWAFKDVGARFLSRCMAYFIEQSNREVTILVATSGDTGGAVAAGFYNLPGIRVKILYPKGKVSDIQQRQLTTWGGNVSAYEVAGTFDDCQYLVKQAFLDQELSQELNLSSANSINIARLIPQSFYYFYAMQQVDSNDQVFCVPSGNYGNLTAGLWAWAMGLPIKKFIAATNQNKVVPDYLTTGIYASKPSIQTYANAMDVGSPSNFVRMLELFKYHHSDMTKRLSGYYVGDDAILSTIKDCYEQFGYLLDPHGAIGYAALSTLLAPGEHGIFLETAHPVKFLDVVNQALGGAVDFQEKSKPLADKKETYQSIGIDFVEFKQVLKG